MKKIQSLVFLAFLFSSHSFSQSFDDGANLISFGFGVPPGERIANDFNKSYKNFIDYKLNNYGTVVLKYEHGLHQYFGVGLNLEYSGASVSYKYDDSNMLRYERKIKSNVFGFYARLNGHIPVLEKLDLYGGVGLGYLYTINKYNDTNPNPNINVQQKQTILDFDYQATVGARFMVKESVGLFVEAGWATTPAQIGIAFKF